MLVGGRFEFLGGDDAGVAASNIARYNPATGDWSSCDGGVRSLDGMPTSVRKLLVLPDGSVIVGGSFAVAGEGAHAIAASRVARYIPATGEWLALGQGISTDWLHSVSQLELLPDGDILVGGRFDEAGGAPAKGLARYDIATGSWTSLGLGLAGNSYVVVDALVTLPDGDVIVKGTFTSVGGLAVNGIARWSPGPGEAGTWSPFWTDLNSEIEAMALLPDGDLVVMGRFTSFEGSVRQLARYQPATGTLTMLAAGPNSPVIALKVLDNGDVLVGGTFSLIKGTPAHGIARFIISTGDWFVPKAGTNGGIVDFAVLPGGDVVAGGWTSAEFSSSAYLGRFERGNDTIVIDQQPKATNTCLSGTAVFSVAASGDGPLTYRWWKELHVVGNFGNPSVMTPTLVISNVQDYHIGTYRCIVSNACGSVSTDPVTFYICRGDLNCDGGVDVGDLLDFLLAFESGQPEADLDDGGNSGVADGSVDINDILYFLARFEAGC
jgi:WD40 repeat protein